MTLTITRPVRDNFMLTNRMAAGALAALVAFGGYQLTTSVFTGDEIQHSVVETQTSVDSFSGAVDLGPAAEWSATNGMTGLSPASVAPIETSDTTVDLSPDAAWSAAAGFTDLTPSDDRRANPNLSSLAR